MKALVDTGSMVVFGCTPVSQGNLEFCLYVK